MRFQRFHRRFGTSITRRWQIRLVMVLVFGVVMTAGLGFRVLGQSDRASARPNQPRLLTVETMTVRPVTSFQADHEYTGSVVARRVGELGFELAGRIDDVLVDEGDRVTPGMPLARLNTDRLNTRRQQTNARRVQAVAELEELIAGPRQEDIDAAGARVESLQAQVELLKLQTQRRKKLVVENATSRDEYEQHLFSLKARSAQLEESQHELQELRNGTRQERIDVARAVVAELDAALAAIDVDLAKSTLIAPFAGTVAKRLRDEGDVLEMGSTVVRLVEDDALEVWVGLPVEVSGRVAAGSIKRVRIGEREFDARVTHCLPELDPATRTRSVILQMHESASQHVVHGQVARLRMQETIDAVGFWVPATSLTRGTRGLWTIYAVAFKSESDPTGYVRRCDVEILHAQEDRVLVRGTLSAGDQIVTRGVHRVVPEQPVRVTNRQPQESR